MDNINDKSGISAVVDKPKKITKYCSVPQCKNYYRKGLSFHLYPKNAEMKRKWEVALKMGKPATATSRVCGEHFVLSDYFPSATNQRYLFPHAVASQKLPLGSVDKPETSPRKRQRVARTNRTHNRDAKKMRIMDSETHHMSTDEEQNSLPDHDDMSSEHPSPSLFFDKEIQANLVDESTANIIHEDDWSFAEMIAENSLDKTAQVHLSRKAQVHQDSHQASSSKQRKSMNLAQILNSNSKLYIFTGIHSLEILDALVECVSDIDVFFNKLRIVLSLKDTIVMTMVKIKMNMDFSALAILFGITTIFIVCVFC